MDFPVFQGITLKLNDKQSCMVARIFHGGMIHRQGNEALLEAVYWGAHLQLVPSCAERKQPTSTAGFPL